MMVPGEESLWCDSKYMRTWGSRIEGGSKTATPDYSEGRGTLVNFPVSLTGPNSDYRDFELYQIVSTIDQNPCQWGFIGCGEITSEVVRVTVSIDNGTAATEKILEVGVDPPSSKHEIEVVFGRDWILGVNNFKVGSDISK